jgi:hypothetical protein
LKIKENPTEKLTKKVKKQNERQYSPRVAEQFAVFRFKRKSYKALGGHLGLRKKKRALLRKSEPPELLDEWPILLNITLVERLRQIQLSTRYLFERIISIYESQQKQHGIPRQYNPHWQGAFEYDLSETRLSSDTIGCLNHLQEPIRKFCDRCRTLIGYGMELTEHLVTMGL